MLLRQGAAVVNLQDVFDNLRFAQKNLSKKVLQLIQTWSPQKVERILNEKPTEQFYDREFTKYDVVVQEGVLTDTQRQIYFKGLVDLQQLTGGPQGPVTPMMLAKAAPLQGKSEFNKELEENQKQAAQAAQEQKQIEQQVLQTQSEAVQAKAISDVALSKERFTRAIANMGLEDERASKAVEDRTDAALNKIRAMKELETLDDDRILKYLSIIQQMEEMSRIQEEQVKSDDVTISLKGAQEASAQTQAPALGQQAPQQPIINQETAGV